MDVSTFEALKLTVGGGKSAGKQDYFTDKTPFTSLDQLDQAKAVVARTGRKYAVYFSERLHVESAMYATELVHQGAIGRVIQVLGLGPHRIGPKASRPAWFYERVKYGGILCDIGSHQFEQYLTFSGATDAIVTQAAVAWRQRSSMSGVAGGGAPGRMSMAMSASEQPRGMKSAGWRGHPVGYVRKG